MNHAEDTGRITAHEHHVARSAEPGISRTGRAAADELFGGGGEMGSLMRDIDWFSTPLGPVESWPASLRTSVGICLRSRFPMLIWWGPELAMLYNDSYRPMLGATKHPRAMGRRGWESWPEIWHIIGPMLERVLTRGEATWSDDQMLMLDRNGYLEECYFTFSYSPIRGEKGGVDGVFSAVAETTERVISQRRLVMLRRLAERTSSETRSVSDACEAAAATFAENAADMPFGLIYLLDDDGKTARLVGSSGVAPGAAASPTEVALGDASDASIWPLARVAQRGVAEVVHDVPERFGALACSPWPEPVQTALVLPLVRAGQEQAAGVLVAGISPRLALDDNYRSFCTLVAGHVAMAIANARAYEEERQRAEALAELDRAKTAFFSNVSHEFRTPLTLMLGPVADTLQRGDELPARVRDDLDLAHRNGLRLLKLVNTLLDFSRVEAGRIEAVYEPTDLGVYTAELASAFRSVVERAGLELVVEAPSLAESVYVDREMWEKIILNLLSNAFKHTFDGAITVRVCKQDGQTILEVGDTGVGIAAAELPRLFERFHRVPNARSRTHEGTGIGLALVQELVKLHGGQITVVSEESVGTTFTVTVPPGTAHLPAERVSVAGAVRERASTAMGAAPYLDEMLRWLPDDAAAPMDEALESGGAEGVHDARLPASAARVLVADDNADMRAYLARLLGTHSAVETVGDGTAALAAVHAHPPDLVLADVMMPGLDGFGLLRAVRADPATRAIPVILLSARAGEEARVEGLAAGADDYVVKPFAARELLARVAATLTLARVRKDAAGALEVARREADAERSKLAALVAQAPAAIAVLRGPQHVFEIANRHYQRLIGGRDVVGRPIREALPELEGQGVYQLLDDVYSSGEPFASDELSVMLDAHGNGVPEERSFNFVYQPVREAGGAVSGIFVQAIDVTDQVRMRREANAANEAKSQFLAAMSHELRTPLNAIAGHVQLIELGIHGPVTDEQREALRRVQNSEHHLLALINDVLNFVKLEAGRVQYDISSVPLAAALEEVTPMMEPLLAAKELTCTVQIPPTAVARADREKLQQILLNLLSNAIKFTDRGGSVTVETGTVDRHGADARDAMIALRVTDTGCGIAPEQHEEIFDPFVQLPAQRTRTQEGTGLGLAISRDLARGMGGELSVESNVGEGSTFTLTLPR